MPSPTVRIGALELTFLVDETESRGSVVMFEMSVPPDARVPAPHHHRDVDEVIYGLAGRLLMEIDGQMHEIGPGRSAFIPRGIRHGFRNPGPDTAKTLSVLTPGTIGRAYFEELAEAVNVGGPPDMARIAAIMARHGLIVS